MDDHRLLGEGYDVEPDPGLDSCFTVMGAGPGTERNADAIADVPVDGPAVALGLDPGLDRFEVADGGGLAASLAALSLAKLAAVESANIFCSIVICCGPGTAGGALGSPLGGGRFCEAEASADTFDDPEPLPVVFAEAVAAGFFLKLGRSFFGGPSLLPEPSLAAGAALLCLPCSISFSRWLTSVAIVSVPLRAKTSDVSFLYETFPDIGWKPELPVMTVQLCKKVT